MSERIPVHFIAGGTSRDPILACGHPLIEAVWVRRVTQVDCAACRATEVYRVAAVLEALEVEDDPYGFFPKQATGADLDLLVLDFGLTRNMAETDSELRARCTASVLRCS